ncbi:hypothetical protein [Mesorhizobium loti]|uniref:hypothetical protein n=1 Tax=Rhizobium loti TaxID=381 RepID=UPI001FDA9FF5|nr:hypothetical protein [Mesorhizobium loti]
MPDSVQHVLWLQHQVRTVTGIRCNDSLEGDADAGKLRRDMGETVGRPIEIDDQTFHCLKETASFLEYRHLLAHAVPRCMGFSERLARSTAENAKNPNSP